MIYELDKNDFEKIRVVFSDPKTHVAVYATLEGNLPGRIFVDDVVRPSAAFIWNEIRYGFLAGDPNNDAFVVSLSQLLSEKLFPEARDSHDPTLVLFPYPQSWETKVGAITKGYSPIPLQRCMYTFNPGNFHGQNRKDNIPDGFRIQRIDAQFLSSGGDLEEEIDFLWGSVDRFLSNGFGFCLLNGNTVVSACFSVFVSGNKREISITTHPEYRKQGFATLTASVYIEHCLRNNLEPVWQCWKDNAASVRLAEKLGFETDVDYPVYFIQLNEQRSV